MAIYILANTVWGLAAELQITDSSQVVTGEQSGQEILTGGPQHLYHEQSGIARRRYVYVNKAGGLVCDATVLTKATRHSGKSVKISNWSAWPSGRVDNLSDAAWAPTCVGLNSDTYVNVSLSIGSGAQAVGWSLDSGDYTKRMSQMYFCTAFTSGDWAAVRSAPEWGSVVIGRRLYLYREKATAVIENLTRAQVNTLRGLYQFMEQPIFIYDSTAAFFSNNLWHCMVVNVRVTQQALDLFTVELDLVRLREYA